MPCQKQTTNNSNNNNKWEIILERRMWPVVPDYEIHETSICLGKLLRCQEKLFTVNCFTERIHYKKGHRSLWGRHGERFTVSGASIVPSPPGTLFKQRALSQKINMETRWLAISTQWWLESSFWLQTWRISCYMN